MASLALSALLAAPPAHAGSYTDIHSDGTSPATVTPTTDTVSTSLLDAAGTASASARDRTANLTYTIQVSPGTLTDTFTWVPASGQTLTTDPPPTCVLVQQSSFAQWFVRFENGTGTGSGNPDCGLSEGTVTNATYYGNGPANGLSATLYSQQSGASFSVSSTPTASFTGTTGTEGGVNGEARVGGGASAYPITISLGGTQPVNGVQDGLTGQQITATLNGIPANYTVTKYTWSGPSATCFKNYNPALTSNQLTPLVSTDTSGPAVGSNAVAQLAFFDSAKEDLTITCAVTLKAPDGKSTVDLTVTAPPINVLKPTATWGVDPKSVPANGVSNPNIVGFVDSSAGSQYFGANTTWYPAKLSVPSPFVGIGQGCFAQIATPSATITRTPTGTGVSTYSFKIKNALGAWVAPGTGLDQVFPFPIGFTTDANGSWTGQASDSSWPVSGTGASGDYPKGQEIVPDVDNGGTQWTSSSISDSFTTWLMYKPDGGVWIPVQSATWKVSGNASGGPNNWSATGSYTAPSPSDTNSFPQWSTVISGQVYHP